jgi:hypothetical protein
MACGEQTTTDQLTQSAEKTSSVDADDLTEESCP